MKPINEMKVTFLSRSANEGFARAAVAAFAAQLDPAVDELADLRTAVSEAVTNCIVHAYPNGIGNIFIRCRILKDNVLDILDTAIELSSMGIRVSPESLMQQLESRGCTERKELTFHKALLNGELPLSIGGGIGQSRLCMFLLQKAHIGEVQASIWPEDQIEICQKNGIYLV